MSELPEKWASCQIGDAAKIVAGGTPPSKDSTNFTSDGGIPWITPADLSGYKDIYIRRGARNLTEKGLSVSSARLIPAGSVLFSSRAPVGYVAIAANDLTTNQGFKSFVFPGELLDSRFIYFYLRHIKPIAEMMATGTTFKELSASNAAKLPLLIAPLNEQKRIADKLDTFLARVDACQTQLERIPQILKRLRQSTLAAAMSGKLLDVNDSTNPDYLPLRQVLAYIKTGPFGSILHKSDYISNGIPVINPIHINGGYITPSKETTISEKKAIQLQEFRLSNGDVILARRGVMGRCAVVSEKEDGWVCGSGSMFLHPTEQLLPEYLQIFLSSPDTVTDLEAGSVGSTMANLNQKALLELIIRLPSIAEQHEIIRRVEDLFAFADQLEARWRAAQQDASSLTPIILAKAFRGELVEQDPNDEPAEVLLERIRAERAAQPVLPRQKPKRTETKERKMTEDTLKEAIFSLPKEKFSFDELREKFPADYEQLKTVLFNLLGEPNPVITQVFDPSARAMRFIRRAK
jgi:type I restriction enzyme S subunit